MFEKLVSFTKKVADLADKPALNPTELKSQFDAAPDEVRTYLNKLIDALLKTTADDSGAKNLGATNIAGLTGTDVQSLLESLNTLTAKKQQEAWTPLTLQNGWVNDVSTAAYRKNSFGEVEVKGRIKNGSTGIGTAIAPLPVGYRTAERKSYAVICHNGSNAVAGQVDVNTDGTIVFIAGGNIYLSLDDIPPFSTS
jgi:hypothetical protein